MSKRDARLKQKGRQSEGSFFRLVHFVLRSVAFQQLSPRAVKVFLALGAEFNGSNNGALALPRSQMAARGFGANGNQAAAGLKELIAVGFVTCTRPGKLKVGPSYYAITIEPIDASDKHNHRAERAASHLWRQKHVCTENVQIPAPKSCKSMPERESPGTKTVPIATNSDPAPSTETVHLYRSTKRSGHCAVASAAAGGSDVAKKRGAGDGPAQSAHT